MIYRELEQIPEEYQPLIRRLIKKGALPLTPNGNLKISEDMLDLLIVLSRLDVIP